MENEKYIGKKSIFKQRIYAKRYYTVLTQSFFERGYSSSRFYFDKGRYNSDIELLKDETVYECNIELPMLEEGEKFYINKLDLLVKISSCFRTSDETVVYYIEDKKIEDEKTKETYEMVKAEIENFDNVKKLNETITEQKDQIEALYNYVFRIKKYWAYKLFMKKKYE
jgi:hypothetical protein